MEPAWPLQLPPFFCVEQSLFRRLCRHCRGIRSFWDSDTPWSRNYSQVTTPNLRDHLGRVTGKSPKSETFLKKLS
ncbi:hypothetical protein HG15A2_42860 [Adhaeretor mobilis]|uniref:Uncharacterized protein n=1 Tax=Adhaeretor mobilis TaxID=1930276 RepID=A0A517N1D2_9BACT|nr:hypothetical protein HG15A2_42860 [Adhaeretor mobilis]